MKNGLDFPDGYRAVIAYDPELEMFRGEFIDLNGALTYMRLPQQVAEKPPRHSREGGNPVLSVS